MKTVGTKLDNSEYEIFEFCCNEIGLSKSEQLRDLIKDFVNDKPNDDSLKVNVEDLESEIVEKEVVMAHGKIIDDDGNVIGTF